MGTRRPLPPAPAPMLSPGACPTPGVSPLQSRASSGAGDLNPNHSRCVWGCSRAPVLAVGPPPHPAPDPSAPPRPWPPWRRQLPPASQSAHLGGAPTAVRVTPKHWKDGVRPPTVVFPREQTRLSKPKPRGDSTHRLWLGSACLGHHSGPTRLCQGSRGAFSRSCPLCTLWVCLCDRRLHIPGTPTQEPAGTQGHV